MERIFCICILVVLPVLCQRSYAQGSSGGPIYKAANILPPSPNAAALAQYGLIPVASPTGSVSTSIPLLDFRTKNLSLPISLSYYSNGVKVSDIASSVGMGWSLNCGGVISRIIRDNPDEQGFFLRDYPQNLNLNDPETLKYIEFLGENEGVDSEPDLYTFSFGTWSGKFVFTREGLPVMVPHANLIIERSLGTGGTFTITTPDGVKYFFTLTERTSTVATSDSKEYDPVETSWYLTRIEHPLGDVITLTYGYTRSYQYTTGVSQTVTRNIGAIGCMNVLPVCEPISDMTSYNAMLVAEGRHVSKIEAVGYGSVDVAASLNRSDLFPITTLSAYCLVHLSLFYC